MAIWHQYSESVHMASAGPRIGMLGGSFLLTSGSAWQQSLRLR